MRKEQPKSRIEQMREKLYQRSFKQKTGSVRPTFYSDESSVATEWKEEENKKMPRPRKKMSFLKKMFIGSFAFFVLALAIAGLMFWGGGNIVSSENVEIKIIGPVSISGGEELALQVIITNENNTPLQFTDLLVEYPDGTYDPENTSKPLPRTRKSLDVIESGETVTEIVRSVVFGEEDSEKEINVTLEYRVEGSNAIFVKEEVYALSISSAPINVAIETNDEANAGQEMKLVVSVSSNTESIMKGVSVRVDYPSGFEALSSDPSPTFGNNIWRIGDIPAGSETEIEIIGIIHGQEEDDKIFRVYAGKQDEVNEREIITVYSSSIAETTIKKPFIGVAIAIDGETNEEYVADSGKILKGTLTWINNLPTRAEDIAIELSISGEVLDPTSVFVDRGIYHSAEQKIVWDRRTFSDLSEVEPGETGRLSFRFSTKDLLSSGLRLENPEIMLNASVRGRTTSASNVPGSVQEFVQRLVKINSDLQLTARAVYTTGPFTNSGPLPPKANTFTTYTIIWTVVNSSNDVSHARVSAAIPPYASWVGQVSPGSEDVSFDEATGEVVWNIGNIDSGAGITSAAKEVAFQILVTPSVAHIGSTPDIISDMSLGGKDDFTGANLEFFRPALNTYLSSDPGFNDTWSRVVE
ncbi:hypothetical protein ACFL0K_02780 [Patescibacteria group bacterium]